MSDHLKRGSERDMEDGEVMEKFYHNVDYLRYMGGLDVKLWRTRRGYEIYKVYYATQRTL